MDALVKRLGLVIALLLASPAPATLTPRQLGQARASPPDHAALPAKLVFLNKGGRSVTLGGIADGKPLVLLFADYTCRNICGPGLTMSAKALNDSGLMIGRDYEFAVIGINPADGLREAMAMRDARLSTLPSIERNVHFLVGSRTEVGAATEALGYRSVYDPSTGQFAHDASLYVFGGDGHLAAMLPELAMTPQMARDAIRSSDGRVFSGDALSSVARLCYGFAAAHGLYGRPVVWGLRGVSVLLLAVLGAALFVLRRKSGEETR